MDLHVLIAPDKFKGTLPAEAAAQAIARGWRKVRQCDRLTMLPISDGGDGFGNVLGELLGARMQRVRTVNAAHQPCLASWWWDAKTKTAVIESANVIGLAMLRPGGSCDLGTPERFTLSPIGEEGAAWPVRNVSCIQGPVTPHPDPLPSEGRGNHPFDRDTFGLAEVIRAAAAKGAQRCLIGIGGSATNDGGFGVARALGWRFLNRSGGEITRWTDLRRLSEIRAPRRRRWFRELILAVDVQNPLLGNRGATRIYGPQKGLRTGDLKPAEACLRKLARVVEAKFRKTLARTPGAGAAGGLGFGLLAFAGARLEPGFKLFARMARLEEHLSSAGLVITGEGRLDESTFMGKGVGQLAERCRSLAIPCTALCGEIGNLAQAERRLTAVRSLEELTSSKQARLHPERWLAELAGRLAVEVLPQLR